AEGSIMTIHSVSARRTRRGLLRSGLILAGILAVLDIGAAIVQFGGGDLFPTVVAVVMVVLGAATLVLVALAWRGSRWAAWTAAGLRLASALTGLPAFFVEGVPAGAVIAAASGIVLAVAAGALIALGLESRR
ncbi:MAG: hypothetical protein WBP48_11420, partial [Microbacterium sp.]